MRLTLTILGCGSSGGVPRLGQGWGACDPDDSRNRRFRCSILLEQRNDAGGVTTVLVDTSPDLREQLLRTGTTRLDGIVLTHSHADHTHGIDDVRPLVLHNHARIGAYMDSATSAVVRKAFGYIFETPDGSMYPPLLDEHRIESGREFAIRGPGGAVRITPFEVNHGEINALGLRVGDVVYMPDVKKIPDAAVAYLAGLDLLVIDALRYSAHPSHFSVDDALGWIAKVKPRRAILTNLHNDLDFKELAKRLPENCMPALDGLGVEVEI